MLGSPSFKKLCCNWLFACVLIILQNTNGTDAKAVQLKTIGKSSRKPITKSRIECFDQDGHSIRCPSKITPAITGAIVGSVIFVMCALGLAYFLLQRRKRQSQSAAEGKYTEIIEPPQKLCPKGGSDDGGECQRKRHGDPMLVLPRFRRDPFY